MANFQFKLRDLVPACLAVALAVAVVHPTCAAAPDPLTPQARADFEWFGTLGFPDLKGCPYVRVATGFWSWNQASEDPPRENIFKAFLLATNADGFRVFAVDLDENRFSLTNPITQGNTRPAFQLLQLTNEVAQLLGAFTNPPPREDEDRLFGSLLRRQSEVFTLAWACWRDGLDADAQRLYEQAQKMRSRSGGLGGMTNLRATLEQDLGMDMFFRGSRSFGYTQISRPQLLAQFESLVTNYPLSEYAAKSKPIISVLKRMVAEDQAHAELGLTKLDQLPVEQQVRELIFRLRDQEGWQSMNPGKCSIFSNLRGATNTPAHQLFNLGYAAVPQLIAALDDTNYSRAVAGGMVLSDVLTVGDCALQILEAISGRTFFRSRVAPYLSMAGGQEAQRYEAIFNQRNGGTNNLPPDDDLASTRKAAQAWWAEVQKKGEKQVLADAVISAGQDAPAQAEMLCQRYPDIAAATIIRGVQAATNSWVHARFIEILSKLDEPQVTDFLSREMSSAPLLDQRLGAAYALREKRKDETMQAMLHEWENLPKQSPYTGGIDGFLADSDSVPAIQALAKDLRQRLPGTRFWVIGSIGAIIPWHANTPSPATLNAIEECLASELDDTEENKGMMQVNQSGILRDVYHVRVCDMAAFYLAQRWPDRYVFDLSPGHGTRERQRVQCLNVWRLAHNLPALPLPPAPIPLKPEQANLVTSIEWAKDSAKPSPDFAARVDAFRDKLLDTNHLVAFLSALGKNPEPQCSGVEFEALKADDLTGVRLTIRLLPGTPPTERQNWNFDRRITLGRKTLERTGGGDSVGKYSQAGSSGWFPDTLSKILAAEPETPFEIWFQIKVPQPQPGDSP